MMSGRQGRQHRASSQAILLTSAQEFSDMRCARLQLIKYHGARMPGRRFLLWPCKRQDHFCAHAQGNSGVRMRPGSRVREPNWKVRGDRRVLLLNRTRI